MSAGWQNAESKKQRANEIARDELLTIPGLARESGVGYQKLYDLVESGALTAVYVGKQKRIPRSEWARYLTRPVA